MLRSIYVRQLQHNRALKQMLLELAGPTSRIACSTTHLNPETISDETGTCITSFMSWDGGPSVLHDNYLGLHGAQIMRTTTCIAALTANAHLAVGNLQDLLLNSALCFCP